MIIPLVFVKSTLPRKAESTPQIIIVWSTFLDWYSSNVQDDLTETFRRLFVDFEETMSRLFIH